MSTARGRGTFEAGSPHRGPEGRTEHMPSYRLTTDAPTTTSRNDAAGPPHAPPTGVPAARDPDALLDNAARRGRPPARCSAATARSHHGRNLRRADEARLFIAARDGDRRAREELVERYLDLARHLARRY